MENIPNCPELPTIELMELQSTENGEVSKVHVLTHFLLLDDCLSFTGTDPRGFDHREERRR